jgi:hypothetical protein
MHNETKQIAEEEEEAVKGCLETGEEHNRRLMCGN